VIWLNPVAWFALAAAAAPILIHILVSRTAERVPFPTLRFIPFTRLAAVRRRALDDALLLAVRVGLLAAAVAAVAGPFVTTAARRRAWDARIVRAFVVGPGATAQDSNRGRSISPDHERIFIADRLSDALHEARAWLAQAPPARREIVFVAPFTVGSIAAGDIADVPVDVGIRFDRSGAVSAALPVIVRLAGALELQGTTSSAAASRIIDREVLITRDRTSVRDTGGAPLMALPIEVRSSTKTRAAANEALTAALEQRVLAPPPGRRVVVVLPEASAEAATIGAATPIRQAWMADAAGRIARDVALMRASSRVAAGIEGANVTGPTFVALASAGDGRPLVAAASLADRLLVVSGAAASAPATMEVLRATMASLAPRQDLQPVEILPISDRQLQAWTRSAPPVVSPNVKALDGDDRRWLWAAALGLLLAESRLRRAARTRVGQTTAEAARVA
jgi:hypothetical protein